MNDKQRADFERWFTSQIDSEYCSTNVKSLLSECWQAALSSVIVDIKNLPSASYTSSGVVYISDVADAIEKAGVRHNDE